VYIWLVLVVAAIARFWHLGARSIWTDEGTAWTIASAPVLDLLRMCAQEDASPPLFYLLTSASLQLGNTEFYLRLVSAIAALGVVWMTYRIARLFAGRHEAAFAAAIVTLTPFQIMYAQEARTYMLVAFWIVLATFFFIRVALLHHKEKGLWAGYIAATAAGLYTQNIALLGVGVHFLFVVLTPEGRSHAVRWFGAIIASLILYAPWLFVTLQQTGHLAQSHWYITAPQAHSNFQLLRAIFLSPISLVTAPPGAPLPGLDAWIPRWLAWALLAAVPLVPLALAARYIAEHSDRGRVLRVMFASLLVPVAVVYALSFVRPLWLPRYFVFVTPFVAVISARGVSALNPTTLRWVWIGAWILLFGYATVRYDTDYTKEPWRDAVHDIARETEAVNITGMARGVAALVTFDADPFQYYNGRYQKAPVVYEMSHPDVPFASEFTAAQLDEMEATALRRVTDFEEVWVVVRSANSDVRRDVAARA
jgi:mannosyltransferase